MEIQSTRADGSPEAFHVGDKLPNALTPGELMRVLNLPRSTFYMHQKAKVFRELELPTPIGVKRYSGRLVERYLSTRRK